jgi:hypothetical protein
MILSKQENALARSERIRRRPRTAASLAALVSAAALAGCASGRVPSDGAMYGAATSEMAVRGFLDGANTDDYGRMADLFGTADGPAVARFGETDIEQRMIFLAGLLKHQAFELQQANLAQAGPGRIRWEARMEGTRKGSVLVPVITVPDGGGRWFVERLNVDALVARPMP